MVTPVDPKSASQGAPRLFFRATSFQNVISRASVIDEQDRRIWLRYLKAAAPVAVITAAGILLNLRVAPTNLAMLYLLAVVLTSFKWGLGPALMSSVISTVVFDYLFIPPYRSVAVTDTWYLITAITLMGVALVISFLTNAVREQATAASRREAHAIALYSLTQSLGGARRPEEVSRAAVDHIKANFGYDVAILLSTETGELVTGFESLGMDLDAGTRAAAERIFQLAVNQGRDPSDDSFLLLRTAAGAIGVDRVSCQWVLNMKLAMPLS